MTGNPWRNLAAMKGPDGKPLIEGLMELCPECGGGGGHPCPVCAGSGRVLVEGPEAILAAQEFILSQPDPDDPKKFWGWEVEKTMDAQVVVTIGEKQILTGHVKVERWYDKGVSDPQPTYAAALAQALERALGKEKYG